MISFITNLLRTVLFAFLLNDYLKRTYPKMYEDILVKSSFNLIYAFSVVQIKLKKLQEYVCKNNPKLAAILEKYNKINIDNNVDFVLEGKIIHSTNISTLNDDHPQKFDFIIYSDCTGEEINKKIISKPITADAKDDYKCEKSDIKFMLIELKFGDKIIKIDLKSDTYNFYVVGNCFTKQFFQYFLIEILKQPESVDNFSIKFIDHNVDTVEVDFSDKNSSILLEKKEYKLSITNDNSEETKKE
jgi:hypothetical protein